jgi:hypothetical protein
MKRSPALVFGVDDHQDRYAWDCRALNQAWRLPRSTACSFQMAVVLSTASL